MLLIIQETSTHTILAQKEVDGRLFYIPRKMERFCIDSRKFRVDYHAMDYESGTMTLEVTEYPTQH